MAEQNTDRKKAARSWSAVYPIDRPDLIQKIIDPILNCRLFSGAVFLLIIYSMGNLYLSYQTQTPLELQELRRTSSIISGMAWALTAYPIDLNPPSEEPNIVLNVTATDNTSFVVLIKDLDNEVPFQDINYGLFNATNYPVAGISITIRDLDNNSRVSKDDRFSITLSSQRPSDQTYTFQLSYRKSGEVLAEVKLP